MKKQYLTWLLLVIGLSLSGLSSWQMYVRSQEQALWGYWPLAFFAGLYLLAAGSVLLFGKKDQAVSTNLLAVSLSGLLLGLSFPDIFPKGYLAFLGFIPLFWLERSLRERSSVATGWKLMGYCYLAFFLWNALATYWVANSSLLAGLFAVLINSLLMALIFLLFHRTQRSVSLLGYPAFIFYWLSFEYLHYHWELNWPWLNLGNSFADLPVLVQWYSFTGVLGGSLWILGINVLLWNCLQKRQAASAWKPWLLRTAALLLVPIAVSLLLFFNYQSPTASLKVLVLQPNYEPHHEQSNVPEREQISRMLQLMKQEMDSTVRFVLIPETSFGFVDYDNPGIYPAVLRLRNFLQQYPKARIIAGVNAYRRLDDSRADDRFTRTQVNPQTGDTLYLEIYNAALQIGAAADDYQWYQKSRLVPGPELFPYPGVLSFLKPTVQRLGGTMAGVAPQEERSLLGSADAAAGVAICYESVFGAFTGEYVRAGAEALFILTNDGWWDQTAGHRQHLAYARLRAIEHRRGVARAANTGISAFIDQRGLLEQRTAYGQTAVLSQKIALNTKRTIYTRYGDLIARFAIFGAAIMLANTIVQGKTRKSK